MKIHIQNRPPVKQLLSLLCSPRRFFYIYISASSFNGRTLGFHPSNTGSIPVEVISRMATGLRWKGKKSLTEQKAPARMSGGSRKAGIYASALVGCPENAGSIPAARFSPCGETGITLRDHEGNAGQKVQIRVYGPPDSSCELNIAGSSPARGIVVQQKAQFVHGRMWRRITCAVKARTHLPRTSASSIGRTSSLFKTGKRGFDSFTDDFSRFGTPSRNNENVPAPIVRAHPDWFYQTIIKIGQAMGLHTLRHRTEYFVFFFFSSLGTSISLI